MGVITVNSRVAYGHVGNAAAAPALLALGVEAWAVDTVVLSNHPGYPTFRGGARPAADVAALLDGLADLDLHRRTRAVISGYLGRAENAAAVRRTVRAVRASSPGAFYACDPIIGDTAEGFYVAEDVRGAIRDELVPEADLLLPNVFEIAWLAEVEPAALAGPAEIAAAARDVAARGRRKAVLVTSVLDDDGGIGGLLVTGDGTWLAAAPRIDTGIKGAGDLLAALFVGRRVLGVPAVEALALAVGGTAAALRRAAGAGCRELALHRAADLLQGAAAAPVRTLA